MTNGVAKPPKTEKNIFHSLQSSVRPSVRSSSKRRFNELQNNLKSDQSLKRQRPSDRSSAEKLFSFIKNWTNYGLAKCRTGPRRKTTYRQCDQIWQKFATLAPF